MERIDKYVWYQEGPGVRKNQYTETGIKLLNVANLVDGKIDLSTSKRYISINEAYGKYKHFLVDEGDLIIASSGIQVDYFDKKMGFASKEHLPLCMNTSTIRFKAIDNNVTDIKYFMYFLKSNIFKNQLQKLITGSAQLNFGPSHLAKIQINMPDINSQQESVQKLDEVTDIIELKNSQIKKLDELIKSQFVEMFENKNFKEKELIELCYFIDYRGKTPTKCDHGIPLITAKNVKNNSFSFEPREYFLPELYESHMIRGIPKVGDVLFTTEAPLGNVCRIPEIEGKFAVGQRIITMQVKDEIKEIYLEYALQSDKFQKEVWKKSSGSTVKRIKSKLLERITIPVPPIHLQSKFTELVKQIDKQKFEIQQSLSKMQELYESLMDKYFG